jgi:hypothetical protein
MDRMGRQLFICLDILSSHPLDLLFFHYLGWSGGVSPSTAGKRRQMMPASRKKRSDLVI